MDNIHSPQEKPWSEVEIVAVGLQTVTAGQCHIGLVHRRGQGLRFLHLAWHHQLREETPPSHGLRLSPNLLPVRARQVAARCRQLWRANGRFVPYGFSTPTDNFDSTTGLFLVGETNLGLTCVTFVLAVFSFAGIPLLHYATWPQRPDDLVWQETIIALLEKTGADPRHVNAVRQTIGFARFRPEEIAAASVLYPPTVEFESVIPLATLILDKLASLDEPP